MVICFARRDFSSLSETSNALASMSVLMSMGCTSLPAGMRSSCPGSTFTCCWPPTSTRIRPPVQCTIELYALLMAARFFSSLRLSTKMTSSSNALIMFIFFMRIHENFCKIRHFRAIIDVCFFIIIVQFIPRPISFRRELIVFS